MKTLSPASFLAVLLLLSGLAWLGLIGGSIADSLQDAAATAVLIGVVLIAGALAARGLRPKPVRVRVRRKS